MQKNIKVGSVEDDLKKSYVLQKWSENNAE